MGKYYTYSVKNFRALLFDAFIIRFLYHPKNIINNENYKTSSPVVSLLDRTTKEHRINTWLGGKTGNNDKL